MHRCMVRIYSLSPLTASEYHLHIKSAGIGGLIANPLNPHLIMMVIYAVTSPAPFTHN